MKAPLKIGILLSICLGIFFYSSPSFGERVAISWETYNPQKDPAYRPKTERKVSWDLIFRMVQDYERGYASGSRQSSQPRVETQSGRYLNNPFESRVYSSVDIGSAGYLNYNSFYQSRYHPWPYTYQQNSPRLFWWSLIPLMNLDNFQNQNSNHHR